MHSPNQIWVKNLHYSTKYETQRNYLKNMKIFSFWELGSWILSHLLSGFINKWLQYGKNILSFYLPNQIWYLNFNKTYYLKLTMRRRLFSEVMTTFLPTTLVLVIVYATNYFKVIYRGRVFNSCISYCLCYKLFQGNL